LNLNDLASFVRVVELGTISAAAAAEELPKSTISRRVARLEEALGVELLRRSGRSFIVTEDGQLLHARAAGALQELADVEQALEDGRETPRGTLVITGPHDLSRVPVFSELLVEYRSRYPEVHVVVRLEGRVVDLILEGVDIGFRAHDGDIPGDPGLMARSLGAPVAGLYASPDYLRRRGTPTTPAALVEHELVAHIAIPETLVLHCVTGDTATTLMRSMFRVNDFGLVQGLAEAGAGVAVLPASTARLPRESALVRLLPQWSTRTGQLTLVWPASRQLAPRVRSFIDLATERMAAGHWGC
jgi:DNA-binding transcriptional LysR family regulator